MAAGDATPARPVLIGSVAAVVSAFSYGVTVVMGRSLAGDGLSGATALGLRFALGASILLAVQALRRGALLPAPGERVRVFLLGSIGYAAESACFFAALGRGTAAAVGLLFYSYPAVVAVIELATGATSPSRRLVGALVLAAAGVLAVIAAGESVSISSSGIALALLASVSFSLYFIASHRLVERTEPVANAAWVSLGAAVSMGLRGVVTGDLESPSGHATLLVGYGVANAFAFAFMFAALRRLGPTRTAVVLTFEVFTTVVLAALFLDESLRPLQLVGGAAIAAGAVLVILSTPAALPERALDVEPPP